MQQAGITFVLLVMLLCRSHAAPQKLTYTHTRRVLQRDSIECSSWGPSQCNRPGVPDKCPGMCSGQPGGGGGNCNGQGACSGNGSGNGSGNCFPGDATVELAGGVSKRMDQLATGDSVAVRSRDGSITYEPVYAWGHRHAGTSTSVKLHLSDTTSNTRQPPAVLELTPTHFVLVAGPGNKPMHKRAAYVQQGDAMWVASGGAKALSLFTVSAKETGTMEGLYNPYTLSGTIIVNGVVASSHSWWFADAAFDAVGLPVAWLPGLYQVALFPARALHSLMGTQAYAHLYDHLDSSMDFANLLSSSAGMLGVLFRLCGVVLLAYLNAVQSVLLPALFQPASVTGAALVGAALVANRKYAAHFSRLAAVVDKINVH